MFHHFNKPTTGILMPELFTNPFYYSPHPLCEIAAKETQSYLNKTEIKEGKMFGVLVVRSPKGELGYLAAFSGLLNGCSCHPYFVPPIYDLLTPNGYFKAEENEISSINSQIEHILKSETYQSAIRKRDNLNLQYKTFRTEAQQIIKLAKQERDCRREQNTNPEEIAEMIRESQFMKAEMKRKENDWKQLKTEAEATVQQMDKKVEALKEERKTRSALLQQWLFSQFTLLNCNGETKTLYKVFDETLHKMPPAGAGECAAPKLLQYAYLNNLHPIAMAEFWWGKASSNELRKEGYYYPACNEKCKPILTYMLQGLQIESSVLEMSDDKKIDLEIVYEDECLVVINKPEGVLSVPGKEVSFSVYEWAKHRYPNATGPLMVHRLDMDTSGLLIVAKNKDVHKVLQEQFANHTVTKKYIALIEVCDIPQSGIIDLPLCCNPSDRPRQMVSKQYGKKAITRYEVIEHRASGILIAFYPLTGRTHQLRVHAAHSQGLNAPIIGDVLYGKGSKRLCLHAASISFNHPIDNKRMTIEKEHSF